MDFRFWLILNMIWTFPSGYRNEKCDGIINTIWNWFQSCNHVQDRGRLDCTDVRLVTLKPSNFYKCELIHELILKNCCLKTIDADAFDELTYLSFLDISNNSLKVLNYKLFNQTKSLSYLILSYNELESIDYRLFSSTMNLSHVDLSHNNLKTFDYRLFEQQKQLIHINLENNELNALHDRVFRAQGVLKELLLGNNLITKIDANVLTPLHNITKIELAGNPLVCQCHNKPTVVWCLNRNLETNARCDYPPEVKGKSWDSLSVFSDCEKFPTKQVINEYHVSLICVGLIVLAIIPVVLYFCWKKHREAWSGNNETAKRSSQELTGCDYYESVLITGENVSSNSSLPFAVSDKGVVYDYVTPSTLHINAVVTDSQGDAQLNKDTTDFLPAAEMIENKLYS